MIDNIRRKRIYKLAHIVYRITTLIWKEGWKTDEMINMIDGKFDKWKVYIEQLKKNNIINKEEDVLV
jgi:hypothetical protein